MGGGSSLLSLAWEAPLSKGLSELLRRGAVAALLKLGDSEERRRRGVGGGLRGRGREEGGRSRPSGDMDEEEHEVYGGEIPDEGEMEGDMDSQNVDIDMSRTEDDAVKVLSTAIFPPPSTAPNL